MRRLLTLSLLLQTFAVWGKPPIKKGIPGLAGKTILVEPLFSNAGKVQMAIQEVTFQYTGAANPWCGTSNNLAKQIEANQVKDFREKRLSKSHLAISYRPCTRALRESLFSEFFPLKIERVLVLSTGQGLDTVRTYSYFQIL